MSKSFTTSGGAVQDIVTRSTRILTLEKLDACLTKKETTRLKAMASDLEALFSTILVRQNRENEHSIAEISTALNTSFNSLVHHFPHMNTR